MASNHVFRFKVTLLEVEPTIWRRFEVPDTYNFWDLHVAIQDVMGWQDYHLHEFRLQGLENGAPVLVGIPDDESDAGRQTLPGWQTAVREYISKRGQMVGYEYDFGDGWEHEVVLEEVLLAEEGIAYPRCVAGERACPPEDCGGPSGYAEFLAAIRDPMHARHTDLIEWIGGAFEAEEFDPSQVRFDDPKERWEIAFSE